MPVCTFCGAVESVFGKAVKSAYFQSDKHCQVFCAGAAEAVPNAQGRVLIPDTLRKYANLDKDVTVIGSGNRVEIWNTDSWNDYLSAQNQSSILDAMELLGI